MKAKLGLLSATAALAIAPAAMAQNEGLYGSIGAGLTYYGYENDVSNDGNRGSGPFEFDTDSDYDNGIGVYAALGYAFANNFRTEFEFSFREAEIDQIDPTGPGFSGIPADFIDGETTTLNFMGNLLYDMDYFGDRIVPYVGGGFGVSRINHDIAGSVANGQPTQPLSIAYGGTEVRPAYQGIAGVGVWLADNLALDLSYRYHGAIKRSINGTLNGQPADFQIGTNSHNLFAGLRWSFGGASEPEPAPIQYKDCWDGSSVPITSECPPQIIEEQSADLDPIDFTVYFDYDKSNLTPQASTLIREAASRALSNDIDTVVVAGNTDTSGSSAYNQALSERRARVVRDALIANGVSADAIRMEAYGETNLAKPTADGVREPLNRRSEVTISFE